MKRIFLIVFIISIFSVVVNASDTELFDEAHNLWLENKYEDAVENYKLLISTYPESTLINDAYFEIGRCYYYLWDMENALNVGTVSTVQNNAVEHQFPINLAVEAFEKVIEIEEKLPLNKGLAPLETKSLMGGSGVVTLSPSAMRWIGDLYFFSGNYTTAIKKYNNLINSPLLPLNKGGEGVVNCWREQSSLAQYKKGKCYEKLKDWENAKTEYQKVVDNFKDLDIAAQAQYDINRINQIIEE